MNDVIEMTSEILGFDRRPIALAVGTRETNAACLIFLLPTRIRFVYRLNLVSDFKVGPKMSVKDAIGYRYIIAVVVYRVTKREKPSERTTYTTHRRKDRNGNGWWNHRRIGLDELRDLTWHRKAHKSQRCKSIEIYFASRYSTRSTKTIWT